MHAMDTQIPLQYQQQNTLLGGVVNAIDAHRQLIHTQLAHAQLLTYPIDTTCTNELYCTLDLNHHEFIYTLSM